MLARRWAAATEGPRFAPISTPCWARPNMSTDGSSRSTGGSQHLPTLLAKCQAYEDYYRTGAEQRTQGVFPRVCWIVPTDARAEQLVGKIEKADQLTSAMFEVTTPERAIATLSGGIQ